MYLIKNAFGDTSMASMLWRYFNGISNISTNAFPFVVNVEWPML